MSSQSYESAMVDLSGRHSALYYKHVRTITVWVLDHCELSDNVRLHLENELAADVDRPAEEPPDSESDPPVDASRQEWCAAYGAMTAAAYDFVEASESEGTPVDQTEVQERQDELHRLRAPEPIRVEWETLAIMPPRLGEDRYRDWVSVTQADVLRWVIDNCDLIPSVRDVISDEVAALDARFDDYSKAVSLEQWCATYDAANTPSESDEPDDEPESAEPEFGTRLRDLEIPEPILNDWGLVMMYRESADTVHQWVLDHCELSNEVRDVLQDRLDAPRQTLPQ